MRTADYLQTLIEYFEGIGKVKKAIADVIRTDSTSIANYVEMFLRQRAGFVERGEKWALKQKFLGQLKM